MMLLVVNCFQNCIFTYDSQLSTQILNANERCELLSELYFYLWFPTICINWTIQITLWIAFRIVFLLMIPNCSISSIELADSCELLSELYFYLWFPTFSLNHSGASTLWIAFRIVFLLMIPNQQTKKNKSSVLWIAFRIVFLLMIPNLWKHQMILYFVVNCFQNCIFTYDSQPIEAVIIDFHCCELLSELYFYLWFPTQLVYESGRVLLWIAFRIVFLLMIPNCTFPKQ